MLILARERRAARGYGERVDGLVVDGRPVKGGVFDERQVEVTAGLTMALGAVAFAYAFLAKEYVPIKTVTAFFFVEFLLRVTLGLRYSPVGQVARLLTRGRAPQWVSAKPKRFAWTLGAVLSAAMTVITNVNIRGLLPMTICLLCLTLMWLEAVLGLCLGCEIYRVMVRRGWLATDDDTYQLCSNGACTIESATRHRSPAGAST